jgi:hypothetical protein
MFCPDVLIVCKCACSIEVFLWGSSGSCVNVICILFACTYEIKFYFYFYFYFLYLGEVLCLAGVTVASWCSLQLFHRVYYTSSEASSKTSPTEKAFINIHFNITQSRQYPYIPWALGFFLTLALYSRWEADIQRGSGVSRVWQPGHVPFGLAHSCQCQTKLIKKIY